MKQSNKQIIYAYGIALIYSFLTFDISILIFIVALGVLIIPAVIALIFTSFPSYKDRFGEVLLWSTIVVCGLSLFGEFYSPY